MQACFDIVDEWSKINPLFLDELSALDILEEKGTTVLRGYSYRAYPTAEQVEFFAKSFGCTRQFWNLLTDGFHSFLDSKGYEFGELPKRWLSALLRQSSVKSQFGYMREIDSLALSNTRLDFIKAVRDYEKFSRRHTTPQYRKKSKQRAEQPDGKPLTFRDLRKMPKFHAKFYSENSYSTNSQASGAGFTVEIVSLVGRFAYVKLPKIKELLKIRLHRDLPDGAKIKRATIRKDSQNRYFITFLTERTILLTQPKTDHESVEKLKVFLSAHATELCLGLDYDQKFGCVPSSGEKELSQIIESFTKVYRHKESKIAALQRRLSRKQKPDHKNGKPSSKAYQKLRTRITKLQAKVASSRRDKLDKLSTIFANKYFLIGVEDINLTAMSQSLRLAKNLLDNGFGMFRSMLNYKLHERGKLFSKVAWDFASSQVCHNCGGKNPQMKNLATRVLICTHCGHVEQRDVNAAMNIRDESVRTYQPEQAKIPGMAKFRKGRHQTGKTA